MARIEVDFGRCEDCPAPYDSICCGVWLGLYGKSEPDDEGLPVSGAAPAWCPLRVGPVLLVGVAGGEEGDR
jgi:hypothetical protein